MAGNRMSGNRGITGPQPVDINQTFIFYWKKKGKTLQSSILLHIDMAYLP